MNASDLSKKKVANLKNIIRGYKAKGVVMKAPLSLKKAELVRVIGNLRARGIVASPMPARAAQPARPAPVRPRGRPAKTPEFKKRAAVGNALLAAKPVGELRAMVKALEIRGAGTMKKDELVRVLMVSRTPIDQRLPADIRARLLARRQQIVPRAVRRNMAPYVAGGYRADVARARDARFENALRRRAYGAGKATGDVVPDQRFLRRNRAPVWRMSAIRE